MYASEFAATLKLIHWLTVKSRALLSNFVSENVKINEELALEWLAKGAIPTDTVKNILSKAGIMKKYHDSKLGK